MKWIKIEQFEPDMTQPPFNGERVMLWMHPDVGYYCVFGRYREKSLWGPVWDFEDGHTVAAPSGATFWAPEPAEPNVNVLDQPEQ